MTRQHSTTRCPGSDGECVALLVDVYGVIAIENAGGLRMIIISSC